MKYRMIGTDPATRRSVSVLSLGAMLMGTRTDEESLAAVDLELTAAQRARLDEAH
jgi:aryl-alcohol dehydrogenase-like predicted oxidoreductase